LAQVINVEQPVLFSKKCREFYDFSYDANRCKFDSLDMSGRLESPQLCESLFKLKTALKVHKKSDLTDVLRYSYLLSMQTYIESEQSKDYGRCEETEARSS
jgi:hypothetical protein